MTFNIARAARLLFCLGWTLTATALSPAFAQPANQAATKGFPSRPVRTLVPLPAGGSMDTIVRGLSQRLTESFGQTFVVDNRPGAGSLVALDILSTAAPDGHTLMGVGGTTIVYPLLYKSRYDIARDFAPVAQLTAHGYVLVIHPGVPAKSVAEFVQHLKANPEKVNYSSSGIGTSGHFTMELLNSITGFDTRHVPYRGAAPALTAVISGEVQMAFLVPPLVTQYLPIGKLRALGISSAARSNVFPQIPTLQEQGVRGYEALQWHGFFGPAAIPDAIVNTLHAAIIKALAHPEVKSRLSSEGAEIVGSTPAQFAAYFQSEVAKWTSVAKRAGIQPQ